MASHTGVLQWTASFITVLWEISMGDSMGDLLSVLEKLKYLGNTACDLVGKEYVIIRLSNVTLFCAGNQSPSLSAWLYDFSNILSTADLFVYIPWFEKKKKKVCGEANWTLTHEYFQVFSRCGGKLLIHKLLVWQISSM